MGGTNLIRHEVSGFEARNVAGELIGSPLLRRICTALLEVTVVGSEPRNHPVQSLWLSKLFQS